MVMTMKVACLFTVAGLVTAGAARASQDDYETYEPELQPDGTPIDFPYTPPPDPRYDPQNLENYGAPQGSEAGYADDGSAAAGTYDTYDDGYSQTAYQGFEDTLAPYGNWIDDGRYGRVWVPAVAIVGNDFTPYMTAGYFVLTEYGWTWVSEYAWGWAPFHYGRWIVVAGYGWCWVPGTFWGPAWVTWRWGDGYVGWAPSPPRGVTLSMNFATSGWRFVPSADLGSRRPRYVAPQLTGSLFKRTTVVSTDRVLRRGG